MLLTIFAKINQIKNFPSLIDVDRVLNILLEYTQLSHKDTIAFWSMLLESERHYFQKLFIWWYLCFTLFADAW